MRVFAYAASAFDFSSVPSSSSSSVVSDKPTSDAEWYRQVPFQFSVHYLSKKLELSHRDFIDLFGSDPSDSFARSVIEALGEKGPIFVYNAVFETGRIKELAERFPRLRQKLLALNDHVVDLLPIAREYYYHPSQEGSWSIKNVLPAIAPDLRYDELTGVQHGGDAMVAYAEATVHRQSSMQWC